MIRRTLLDFCVWRMCSDPWPVDGDESHMSRIDHWLNQQARALGFRDWVDAYHRIDPQNPGGPLLDGPGIEIDAEVDRLARAYRATAKTIGKIADTATAATETYRRFQQEIESAKPSPREQALLDAFAAWPRPMQRTVKRWINGAVAGHAEPIRLPPKQKRRFARWWRQVMQIPLTQHSPTP